MGKMQLMFNALTAANAEVGSNKELWASGQLAPESKEEIVLLGGGRPA